MWGLDKAKTIPACSAGSVTISLGVAASSVTILNLQQWRAEWQHASRSNNPDVLPPPGAVLEPHQLTSTK
jgi:hypothetical protein